MPTDNAELLAEDLEIDATDEELREIELVDLEKPDYIPDSVSTDSVSMYLKEIGNYPLLTFEEEVNLAKTIEAGKEASHKKAVLEAEILSSPSRKASKQQEKLLASYQMDITAADAAKKKLVSCNLRLVVSVAKYYSGVTMQFLDIIQEGNLGLLIAAERFDYHKGFKFSTYAIWWIRQAITRSLAAKERPVRLPVHVVEHINRMMRIQRDLLIELGHEPSDYELSVATGYPEDKVTEYRRLQAMTPVSLETPVNDEGDTLLGDMLSDENVLSPSQEVFDKIAYENIREVLNTLQPRERDVIILRFGLDGEGTRTLEEVSRMMHVTRERIRQIEGKAIVKLRRGSRSRALRDFIH